MYREDKRKIVISVLCMIAGIALICLTIIGLNSGYGSKKAKEQKEVVKNIATEKPIETVTVTNAGVTAEPDEYIGNDVYSLVEKDFELLKSDDSDTKHKYYGMSTTIDNEDFSRLLKYTEIHKIDSTNEKKDNLNRTDIHICSVDTEKLNKEIAKVEKTAKERNVAISTESLNTIVDRAIKKKVKKYKKCYQITVEKDSSTEELIITEEFKSAITGKWYTGIGVKLENVKCKY